MINPFIFVKNEFLQMQDFINNLDSRCIAKNRFQKLRYCDDFDRCTRKYHIDVEEYFVFQFYNKTSIARDTYISDIDSAQVIPKIFNNDISAKILCDKSQFNTVFDKFIGREWMVLDNNNFDLFVSFCKKNKIIIVKPIDSYCGCGIEKIDTSLIDLHELYNKLLGLGSVLIEEFLTQNEKMSKLNPDTINTIRILSVRDSKDNVCIPVANIRIGRKGKSVDNFHSGGLTASIDVESGILISNGMTKSGDWHIFHPYTGTQIIGFSIPFWDRVLETVKIAADYVPKQKLLVGMYR